MLQTTMDIKKKEYAKNVSIKRQTHNKMEWN